MNDAMREMPWTLGNEFDMVVVSIDAREKPELAAQKKASYIKAYGRPDGARGWHFLTGDEPQIQALARQVGFKYRWDEKEKQFAHASAAYVLTPDGRISRYLYGIVFTPQVLRLSLVEAGDGKIGSIVDKLTLWCFHYDPSSSKYALAATSVMRGGGVAAVLALAAFLFPFWYRQRSGRKIDLKSGMRKPDTAKGEA
jgi:protein SCO1/2